MRPDIKPGIRVIKCAMNFNIVMTEIDEWWHI